MKCPRCGSKHLDYLKSKYGVSISAAFYGDNDYECRDCSAKFKAGEVNP